MYVIGENYLIKFSTRIIYLMHAKIKKSNGEILWKIKR